MKAAANIGSMYNWSPKNEVFGWIQKMDLPKYKAGTRIFHIHVHVHIISSFCTCAKAVDKKAQIHGNRSFHLRNNYNSNDSSAYFFPNLEIKSQVRMQD